MDVNNFSLLFDNVNFDSSRFFLSTDFSVSVDHICLTQLCLADLDRYCFISIPRVWPIRQVLPRHMIFKAPKSNPKRQSRATVSRGRARTRISRRQRQLPILTFDDDIDDTNVEENVQQCFQAEIQRLQWNILTFDKEIRFDNLQHHDRTAASFIVDYYTRILNYGVLLADLVTNTLTIARQNFALVHVHRFFVNCPICLETQIEGDNFYCFAQCGHGSCGSCLQQFEFVLCPSCRAPVLSLFALTVNRHHSNEDELQYLQWVTKEADDDQSSIDDMQHFLHLESGILFVLSGTDNNEVASFRANYPQYLPLHISINRVEIASRVHQ